MKYLNTKGDKGFTLVEIILTIAILAIAFVPALGYFSNSINQLSQIEQRNQAIKIATDIMENIKFDLSNNWEGLDTEDYSIDKIVASDYSLRTDDFKVESIDIDEDFENDEITGKKITVTVSWNDSNNSLELRSLVVKR